MNVGDIIADGEYTVVKLTIKGGAAHRVPAPPEALAAVNQYLLMAGHTKGPIFRRVKGGDGRLSRIAIYNLFKKAVKQWRLFNALCPGIAILLSYNDSPSR